LDTSGVALKASLGHHLDLLKTSLTEFESILGREVREPADQEKQAIDLVRSGIAGMIALSLGRDGAILATAQGAVRLPAAATAERTGVGAGDSFLGGLILALARGQGHKEALQLGIAAGSSAVAGYGTARVRRSDVESICRLMTGTTGGASLTEGSSSAP
jgi:6-phosphofructokinase 2